MLSISADAVKQICRRGPLPGAVKRSGRWFLPAHWVRAEVRRRTRLATAAERGRGRPSEIEIAARNADKTPISEQTGHLENVALSPNNMSGIVTNQPAA